jgi:hypothetical protein
MSTERDVVVTIFGHDRAVDKIAVNLFNKAADQFGLLYHGDSNANAYCTTINSLELNENSWVFARIVSENVQYPIDTFLPLKFDIFLRLDDRAIQKILRNIDALDLARALKGEQEAVRERIFRNMSKNTAQILKEDMEYMGEVPVSSVKGCQAKIMDVIYHLEQTGEIVVEYGGMIK